MDEFFFRRLKSSMVASVSKLDLNLVGLTVLTECATGPYICTPAIAAIAGAERVVAYGKDGRFGSFSEVSGRHCELFQSLGISSDRLILTNNSKILDSYLSEVDIITNSGHLRPITGEQIRRMKKTAVIPLMYESWEFRQADLDHNACLECGIACAGTNERHPELKIFEYLGPIVAKALMDEGLELCNNKILVVSDNDFGPYIENTLRGLGADVLSYPAYNGENVDVVVFAHTPYVAGGTFDLQKIDLPPVIPLCCQLWGDVDRSYFETKWIPFDEPEAGHMGVMLSSLGVEPVVRLQAGGLKVGQLLAQGMKSFGVADEAIRFAESTGFGQRLGI